MAPKVGVIFIAKIDRKMDNFIVEIYTQIKQKGIITIPMKLRKQMGLIDNDLLRMKIVKNAIMLEPVRVLPYKTRSYTSNDILDFLELNKNESQNLFGVRKVT